MNNIVRMKSFNLLIVFTLLAIFILPNSFSVMHYDEVNKPTYYVSKTLPTIYVNISSGTKDLIVEKGVLKIDTKKYEYNITTKRELLKFESHTYKFNLNQDISKLKNINFKLIIYDKETGEFVKPMGDPIDFAISYDNVKPEFVGVNYDISENSKYLILEFSERLQSLKIKINDIEVKNVDINTGPLFLDSKNVKVDITDFEFDEKENILSLDFKDLAENKNSAQTDIYLPGTEFEIKLMTLRDDSSLSYNYNTDIMYKNLFAKTIYSKDQTFDLKLRTSKKANCYFSSGIDVSQGFPTISVVRTKKSFTTQNNFEHSITVDTNIDKEIWVACQTFGTDETEILYLSESLDIGKSLIYLKKYLGGNLEIDLSEPSELVSNIPFSLFVDTNNRAVCTYELDGSKTGVMNTSNFINHIQGNIDVKKGDHKLKFECVDVLNNKKTVTNDIDVDPERGVKIVDYSPKYVMVPAADVEFFLSEYEGVTCKFSPQRTSKSDFDKLNNVSKVGLSRNKGTFSVSNLMPGKNELFIYCKKVPDIVENVLEIIYDTKGVQITNFSFVNGNYLSDYASSKESLSFKFNVDSLIPVSNFTARILDMSGKILISKSFNGQSLTLSGDFSNASKLQITGTNDAGYNGTFEKVIVYDLTPPIVDISFISGSLKIICVDYESSCSDKYYGFSQTNIDCLANKKYESENINPTGNNYVCVEAYNFAGLKTFEIKSLTNDNFQSLLPINKTIPTGQNKTTNETKPVNNGDKEEPRKDFNEDPFKKTDVEDNSGSDNFTYILIASIILLLAGVGGGGFYAYKKGYLDNELKKLGINVGKKNSASPATGTTSTSQNAGTNSSATGIVAGQQASQQAQKGSVQFTPKPIVSSKKVEESSYDKHLKKLNSFIDSKISKSKSSFDKFDDGDSVSSSDNSKSQSETKKEAQNMKSVEEFDEFYEKSKKAENVENRKSNLEKTIEQEADSFEEYQKKKGNK